MPTTWKNPDRAARWPGMDVDAIEYLSDAGYRLNVLEFSWTLPTPHHRPTERELDAIAYLTEEWDFDGIRDYRQDIDGGMLLVN